MEITSLENQTKLDEPLSDKGREIEIPKIIEQLRKISELKVDDLMKVSADKFDKTVQEMFAVIKSLEGHLRTTLELNKSLKTESQQFKKDRDQSERCTRELEKKLVALEAQAPLASDLERRLELTIEEVEKNRGLYKLESQKVEKLTNEIKMLVALQKRCEQERDDAYQELVIIENKIELGRKEKEDGVVRELRERLETVECEKKRLAAELMEARKGLEEIHRELQS